MGVGLNDPHIPVEVRVMLRSVGPLNFSSGEGRGGTVVTILGSTSPTLAHFGLRARGIALPPLTSPGIQAPAGSLGSPACRDPFGPTVPLNGTLQAERSAPTPFVFCLLPVAARNGSSPQTLPRLRIANCYSSSVTYSPRGLPLHVSEVPPR